MLRMMSSKRNVHHTRASASVDEESDSDSDSDGERDRVSVLYSDLPHKNVYYSQTLKNHSWRDYIRCMDLKCLHRKIVIVIIELILKKILLNGFIKGDLFFLNHRTIKYTERCCAIRERERKMRKR